MSRGAYDSWLKDLYCEVSIFSHTGLISVTLTDKFKNASPDFLKQKYNTFCSLRDLGANKDLPILEVLNFIPEEGWPYNRQQYVSKLKDRPDVPLLEIPKMSTSPSRDKKSKTSSEDASGGSSGSQSGSGPPGSHFACKEGNLLKVSEFLPDTFQGFSSENARNHFEKYKDYCQMHSLLRLNILILTGVLLIFGCNNGLDVHRDRCPRKRGDFVAFQNDCI